MRTKSIDNVDLPDGHYKGRLGGKTVVIKRLKDRVRFDVEYDAGELSIGVYVTIKDGKATVLSNNHY